MRVDVPDLRNDLLGYNFLAGLSRSALDLELFDDLVLDFAKCEFFEANMAAPLAAILASAERQLVSVKLGAFRPKVRDVLCKNSFLGAFGHKLEMDANRTTIPFRRYRRTDGRLFAEHLEQHLAGKGLPRMSAAMETRFRSSLLEVFQNAADHSDSEVGIFVCGQFFPTKRRVDLTIADGGIGIRDRVRTRLGPSVSSIGAMKWAFQKGSTTRTGDNPGGMGLKLLADFIEQNGGRIHVASRQGFCEFFGGHYRFSKLAGDYQGTSVTLEVNTSDMARYDVSRDTKELRQSW